MGHKYRNGGTCNGLNKEGRQLLLEFGNFIGIFGVVSVLLDLVHFFLLVPTVCQM